MKSGEFEAKSGHQKPKSGIARAKKWRAKKRGMPLINEAYLL